MDSTHLISKGHYSLPNKYLPDNVKVKCLSVFSVQTISDTKFSQDPHVSFPNGTPDH